MMIFNCLQTTEMESMPRLERLGYLSVISEDFCQQCLPYPQEVLKAVHYKLPAMALKRNEDLLTIIKV